MIAPAFFRLRHERRVVRRHVVLEGEHAASRRQVVFGKDVVLEGHRDAVEWTANAAGGALSIERIGLCKRIGIDGDGGVQAILVETDANQVLRDDLARGDAAFLHSRLHLGDGGGLDLERRRGRDRTAAARRKR